VTIQVSDRVRVVSTEGEWSPHGMNTLRDHEGIVEAINGPYAIVTFSDIVSIIRSGIPHPVPMRYRVRLANLAKVEETPT
jgi:hypothetical protein